jgi:arsenate reductase (thioredoxin)
MTEQLADTDVRRVIDDLSARHRGVLSRQEVEGAVHGAFAELRNKARVTGFLPVLARRKAEERLCALARERHEPTRAVPKVVFVCRRNEGRSQLAAALLDHHARGRVDVRTTGTEPTGRLNPVAVQSLAELGIQLPDPYPEPPSEELIRQADVVVNMCGETDRPDVPSARYLDWDLPDPAGRPIEEVRVLRDELDRRIRELLRELST